MGERLLARLAHRDAAAFAHKIKSNKVERQYYDSFEDLGSYGWETSSLVNFDSLLRQRAKPPSPAAHTAPIAPNATAVVLIRPAGEKNAS